MQINFCIRGRLGNAIFRYLASAVMCINNNGDYICGNSWSMPQIDDEKFQLISNLLLTNTYTKPPNMETLSVSMTGFYQHDAIYKKYKMQIIDFITNNKNHEIITDGILAGDNNCEKYKMVDILYTPATFTKKYKNVLHLRLEDFVTHNMYIPVSRIIDLFRKYTISDSNTICIVCKTPSTPFEKNYIKELQNFLKNEKKTETIIESNDTLTDYYIMKEATNLICSKSTLSWCAAFFSTSIQTCYMPEYEASVNSTCKYPNDNADTFLY